MGLICLRTSSGETTTLVELDLDVLLEGGLADGVIGDVDAAGEHGLQAVELHVALDLGLKAGAGSAERALDEIDVSVVADVRAVGEKVLREGAGAQLASKIFVADLKMQPIGLMLEDLALDEDLAGTLFHVGHEHVRQVLLLKLALRELGDLSLLDGRSTFEATGPAWIVNSGIDVCVAGGCRSVKDAQEPA